MAVAIHTTLIDLENRHALEVRGADEATVAFLNTHGLEGNGYTWAGIVDSIARLELASEHASFGWSPEADDLLVTCRERAPLERLRAAVARYAADESLLKNAIAKADPEMMD